MSNKVKTAEEIQRFLDWEYNFDLAMYQNSELKMMAEKIQAFLALDVDTDDMMPADGDDSTGAYGDADGIVEDEDSIDDEETLVDDDAGSNEEVH